MWRCEVKGSGSKLIQGKTTQEESEVRWGKVKTK
jgi:hypothetical protein